MRKKYLVEEDVFGFIWDNANSDGIWDGDAASLAQEFGVSEDAAHLVLSELCDRNRIQRVGRRDYIIVRWRERDEPGEQQECC